MLMFGLLLVFTIGCSGGGVPTMPSDKDLSLPRKGIPAAAQWHGNRLSWGMFLLHVNEDHTAIDIEPLRSADFHINVQPFVEYLFCKDCLQLGNISASGHGSLLVDITLIHPFKTATDLTGFDVRGTAIFNAEKLFPNTYMPDGVTSITASGRVLNADGWTTHFNPEGTQGYYEKGKLVAPWCPTPIGNCHPFRTFWTNSNRRIFEVNQSVTRTYDIKLPPGAFTFGYSIDASWEPPNPNPPNFIPDDFPITANSVEAFELSPTIVSNGLTRTGGSAILDIEVFDWQGPTTIDNVFVEAPDLFPGTQPMTPTGVSTPTSATYTVTLNNLNMSAPTATGVDVLVCAVDTEYTTTTLDLRAFRIINLPVTDVPPAWRPRHNTFHNIPMAPIIPDGTRDFGVGNPDLDPGPGVNKQLRVYFKREIEKRFYRYNDDFSSALVFAGYPGGASSWLAPATRMDVTNSGIMAVLTDSWNQDLQPALNNYNMTLVNFFYADGLYNHSWYSVPDNPGDPNDYQERAIDISNGWGDNFGDPMYALYAYEMSASTGPAPATVSILKIREPYNNSVTPLPATRTTVPRGIGLGLIDESTVQAFAIDDNPAEFTGTNTNIAYILDNDGIEIFQVYFVSLPSIYRGTISTSMIPVPGVFPVDIEGLPAYRDKIWTGSAIAKSNWLAVLLDVSLTNEFVVAILRWNFTTNMPMLLATTNIYPGTPLYMDVDIDDFEIYVWSDNAGVTEATVFEYY